MGDYSFIGAFEVCPYCGEHYLKIRQHHCYQKDTIDKIDNLIDKIAMLKHSNNVLNKRLYIALKILDALADEQITTTKGK